MSFADIASIKPPTFASRESFNTNFLGRLRGSRDMNVTGSRRCFFGSGTGRCMKGSKVTDTCQNGMEWFTLKLSCTLKFKPNLVTFRTNELRLVLSLKQVNEERIVSLPVVRPEFVCDNLHSRRHHEVTLRTDSDEWTSHRTSSGRSALSSCSKYGFFFTRFTSSWSPSSRNDMYSCASCCANPLNMFFFCATSFCKLKHNMNPVTTQNTRKCRREQTLRLLGAYEKCFPDHSVRMRVANSTARAPFEPRGLS